MESFSFREIVPLFSDEYPQLRRHGTFSGLNALPGNPAWGFHLCRWDTVMRTEVGATETRRMTNNLCIPFLSPTSPYMCSVYDYERGAPYKVRAIAGHKQPLPIRCTGYTLDGNEGAPFNENRHLQWLRC